MDESEHKGKQKEYWKNFNVAFEADEEIQGFSVYHRNPTVGQALVWRAMSLGMTAQYNVLITNKRAILLPHNNNATFKREAIRYIPFNKVKIIGDSGVLEFEIEERKTLRLTPIRWANKLGKTSHEDLIESIRANQ